MICCKTSAVFEFCDVAINCVTAVHIAQTAMVETS